MNVRIEKSWKDVLAPEFNKLYFELLVEFVKKSYKENTIYPPAKDIFKAFDLCPFDQLKVVILGQDPYHEAGQAEGLAFSVPPGVKTPPSLQNILKEIETDLGHPSSLKDGNLNEWAQQGVLLLNASLTVEAHKAGSHQNKGWETFTDKVIEIIAQRKEGIVFLLWGNFARKKAAMISPQKHLILEAAHPSPLSASRGFFKCKHFSKTNQYLVKNGKNPILW